MAWSKVGVSYSETWSIAIGMQTKSQRHLEALGGALGGGADVLEGRESIEHTCIHLSIWR